MTKKIIIIGAGPAGLTAAYEFSQNSKYEVIVLEESTMIGGISKTIEHNGNRMDIGGHRFFSRDKRIEDWWLNIFPLQGKPSKDDKILNTVKDYSEGGPDPEITDEVFLVRNRISRILYNKKFFDYPVSLKISTIYNMGFLRAGKALGGYIISRFKKRPEKSLEDFYINRFGRPLYSMFFEKYTEKVWGVHPSELDADWGEQRIKSLSLFGILKEAIFKPKDKETSLIDKFIYPKYGPGQLWERVAEKTVNNGGKIYFSHKVEAINIQNGIADSVTVKTEAGENIIAGDYILSTMPICSLIKGIRGIPVPGDVADVSAGLSYRDFISVGLLMDRLEIRNNTKIKTINGIIPDTWIYIQEPHVKIGRLQIFNNWSPYMVDEPEDKVWLGLEYFCTEGDSLWSMTDEEIKEIAANELQIIGIIDKSNIEDSTIHRERKAYPSYHRTYKQFPIVRKFLDSIPNLYYLGRNGQHRYNNMDHSMLTGFEAVKLITHGINSKESLWAINTEKLYNEKG